MRLTKRKMEQGTAAIALATIPPALWWSCSPLVAVRGSDVVARAVRLSWHGRWCDWTRRKSFLAVCSTTAGVARHSSTSADAHGHSSGLMRPSLKPTSRGNWEIDVESRYSAVAAVSGRRLARPQSNESPVRAAHLTMNYISMLKFHFGASLGQHSLSSLRGRQMSSKLQLDGSYLS